MRTALVRRNARPVLVGLGLLALTVAARPVAAQDVMTAISNKRMEAILDEMSITYTKKSDTSWRLELDDYKVLLLMGNDNEDAQLYIGFGDVKVTSSQMNEWNKGHRFGRAYMDDDGNPSLEADLDFAGGVTEGTIKAWIKLFQAQVSSYVKYLNTL